MFASRISTTAKAVGAAIQFTRSVESVLTAARAATPSLVILDLNSARTQPLAIVAALRERPGARRRAHGGLRLARGHRHHRRRATGRRRPRARPFRVRGSAAADPGAVGAVTPPTALDVVRARLRLQRHLSPTPLRESLPLGATAGRRVLLKLESLNLTHSFKIRGAFNALLALIEAHPDPCVPPARRHRLRRQPRPGHGLRRGDGSASRSWCSRRQTAPRAKTDAIRRHGATLHLAPDYDAAEQQARDFADEHGAAFISPYNHPDVIAGAGTIGLEIVEQCPDVGTVVVPIGGGGLASGVGLALRAAAPRARLVGVEADASTPFTTSLARGAITTIDAGPTLADGLAGNLEPGSMTFALVQQVVDEVVTVSESALIRRDAADGRRRTSDRGRVQRRRGGGDRGRSRPAMPKARSW